MRATTTADTSVVVPALAEWHERHALAREATASTRRLPAHVLAETFSVLTRLPHGLAIAPDDAAKLLCAAFPEPPLALDGRQYYALVERAGSAGLRGGQVYDAVVAATCVAAELELLTLDQRAAATYEAIGVSYQVLTEATGSDRSAQG